jgi:C4-dicarboxylate-binding protein DctP
MKNLLLILILFITISNFSIASTIENSLMITISHTSKANSIRGKSAIRFKEMLETKFPQKVQVKIYENGSLYKGAEELEALDLSGVNMVIISTDQVERIKDIKELQLFDLPFLFKTNNEFNTIINGKSGEMLLGIINKKLKDSEAIGFLGEGFRNFAGHEFYKTPNDLINNTIITTSVTQGNGMCNGFKAKTVLTVNSFEDNSLLNKADSIADISLNNFIENNISTLKNITESQHNYNADVILVNKYWFDNLSEDIRNNILEVVKNTNQYNLDLINKTEISSKLNLKKSEIIFYQWNNNELEAFKKSVIPVHANFLNNINKELLLETYKEIKNK